MLLEDDVRELMHHATDDVSAPAHVGSSIAATHRRRQTRRTVTSLALTGLTVGAVAVATYPRGSSSPATAQLDPATASPSTSAVHLTAAQRTLIGLSEVAARGDTPSGRYVVMSEIQDQAQRTSVIDAITGDVWTYQKGQGVPNGLAVARHSRRPRRSSTPSRRASGSCATISSASSTRTSRSLWARRPGRRLRVPSR